MLQETLRKSNLAPPRLQGYDIYVNHSEEGGARGQLTAIANDLPSKRLYTTTLGLAEHEVIEVEVHTAKQVIRIFNLYRGFLADSNFDLTPLEKPHKNEALILAGDLNAKHPLWGL